MNKNNKDYRSFYDNRRHETYAQDYNKIKAEEHAHYHELKKFINKFKLIDKKCLEIGSSGGFFQDMVEDYYGTDIGQSLAKFYHKPYKVADNERYPFEDCMFDAIWTITVYEHIPHLQKALEEIYRLLKPGGVVMFAPAWQCRTWAADGYSVRPYSAFNFKGKLIKASIPIRDSVFFRSLFIFPKRLFRHLQFLLGFDFKKIRYKKLNPNYDIFWTSDADACNSIDPHDAILWFLSNNFKCLSHPNTLSVFFVRGGSLIFRKKE